MADKSLGIRCHLFHEITGPLGCRLISADVSQLKQWTPPRSGVTCRATRITDAGFVLGIRSHFWTSKGGNSQIKGGNLFRVLPELVWGRLELAIFSFYPVSPRCDLSPPWPFIAETRPWCLVHGPKRSLIHLIWDYALVSDSAANVY